MKLRDFLMAAALVAGLMVPYAIGYYDGRRDERREVHQADPCAKWERGE